MFPVELTDLFIMYDQDKNSCISEMNNAFRCLTYPSHERSENVLTKNRTSNYIFPKSHLSVQYHSIVETEVGSYWKINLLDYGVKTLYAIYYRYTDNPPGTGHYEFYCDVQYDNEDTFSIYFPYELTPDLNEEYIEITAIVCDWRNEIVTVDELGRLAIPDDSKTIRHIVNVRSAHTSQYRKESVLGQKHKVRFDDDFIGEAWKIYPDISKQMEYLSKEAAQLNSLLPFCSCDEIDLSPPQENEPKIYIPVDCTYNKRFFAKLSLLKNHTVANRVVSKFGIVQYEIPVKATNIPLMLAVYGSHYDTETLTSGMYSPLGTSLCTNTEQKMQENSDYLKLMHELSTLEVCKSSEGVLRSALPVRKFRETAFAIQEWSREILKTVSENMQSDSFVWKSEYRLFKYVNVLFPDAIYQYRATWLGEQSLDIYIPSCSCGIEYQGKQHYEAVSYFGGEEKLIENQERDSMKRQKCQENGILILEWQYSRKLEFEAVVEFVNSNIPAVYFSVSDVEAALKRGLPFKVCHELNTNADRYRKSVSKPVSIQKVKTIYQYDLTGKFLSSFNSFAEATITGASEKQIRKVLCGYANTAGGYQWRRCYPDEFTESISAINVNSSCKAKCVLQISLDGEVIAEYPSIKAAARSVNSSEKSIREVIKGNQHTAKGFYWTLKEE